jgi:hypothetical protein
MDNELHGDDIITVSRHVESCELCKKRLGIYNKIGSGLNSLLSAEPSLSGQDALTGVISRFRQNKRWLQLIKEMTISSRAFIPAGVAISIALVAVIFLHRPGPAGPSAIISSISCTGVNTIIYETPDSKQTILWIKENG